MIKDCKMRHKNGNCLPVGGFCTANKNICEALQNAYSHGYFEGCQTGFEKSKEQKWIPVSEGLPKVEGLYIVTDSKGDVVRFVYENTEMSRRYWKRCAKAWMPSPKPYKGDKE